MSIRYKLTVTFASLSLLIGLVGLLAVNQQIATGEAAAFVEARDAANIIADTIAYAPGGGFSQALYNNPLGLEAYVTELKHRLDRHVVVVDGGERVLADAGNDALGPVYNLDPNDEVAQTMADGIPRTFAEKDISHPARNLHVVVPLRTEASGDTIGAVVLDYSETYQQMQAAAWRAPTVVALAAGGGILIALLLGYFIFGSIARPLTRLSTAFEEVRAGRTDVKVEASSRDEIGSLARGFNAMVTEMGRARKQLERQAAELTRSNEYLSEQIAERDRVEKRLSEQEQAYRTLAQNLPGIVYRLHLREDQRIEFFNEAALPAMGFDRQDLQKGRVCPCESLMVPEDRAPVAATVERAIAQGQPFSIEYRCPGRDGQLRYLLGQGTPVKGADGEPLYIDSVIFDVTERAQAAAALQENERRFRQLMQAIDRVVWIYDPAFTKLLYISPAYERVWGRACQSAYADPMALVESVHPEDRENLLEQHRQHWHTGYEVEYRIVRPEGAVRWVRTRTFPIRDEAGQVYRIGGLAADITEQKQAEDVLWQQAQVIDQIHDAVISTDLEGYVTSWNRGAERLTGYTRAEALGRYIGFLYAEDQQEFLKAGVIAPLLAKGTHDVEVPMRDKPGREFFAHVALSVLRDQDGLVTGMIGYSMDITERKRAEWALKRSEERFRAQYENIPMPTYTWQRIDGDFVLVGYNAAADAVSDANITGYLGMTAAHMYASEPQILADFERCYQEQTVIQREMSYTHQHRRASGIYNVHYVFVPPDLVMVHTEDVTQRKRAEKIIRARGRQHEALADLGQQALTETDLTVLMDRAVRHVTRTLEVETAYILELLPGGETLLLRAGVGWRDGLVGSLQVEADSDAYAGYTLACASPVVVADLQTETRFDVPAFLLEHQVSSGASVAIASPGGNFGVLGAHTFQSRNLDADELHFLQAVAQLVSVAITRRQWEAALIKYVARLEILQRLDRSILAATSLHEIAKAAVEGIADLMPVTGLDVLLFDADTDLVTMIASHAADGKRTTEADLPRQMRAPMSVFGDVNDLRQGQTLVIHDVEHTSMPAAARETLRALGVRAYFCVPLIAQEELLGVISLGWDQPAAFTPEQIETVQEVAHALAVAVQQSRLLEQLRQANQRLKSLSFGLVEMLEEERLRLARELHDEIGQTLTAVKINLQTVQRRLGGVAAAPEIGDSIAVVQDAMEEVRNLALDLRPSLLDDLGLVATLRWYLDRQAHRDDFEAGLVAHPADLRLPPKLEVVCFRIVQEALTNVLRHANATHVQVVLEQHDTAVDLLIQDDGGGFDVAAALARAAQGASLGLVGMQERAALADGQVQIDSAPGRGTQVRARFSVSNPEFAAGPESGAMRG